MLVALRDHVASWGPISMERILSETQRSQLRNGTEQRDVGLAHSEPTLPLPASAAAARCRDKARMYVAMLDRAFTI